MIATESGFATRQITNSNAAEFYPIVSPDNSKILFVQEYSDGSEYRRYLWTHDLTNDALTQYVEGFAPSFTPDGKKIVATRRNRENGHREIWLIDLEKGQEFLILSARDQSFLKLQFRQMVRNWPLLQAVLQQTFRPMRTSFL
jgi:Tol biopolymer transport system component